MFVDAVCCVRSCMLCYILFGRCCVAWCCVAFTAAKLCGCEFNPENTIRQFDFDRVHIIVDNQSKTFQITLIIAIFAFYFPSAGWAGISITFVSWHFDTCVVSVFLFVAGLDDDKKYTARNSQKIYSNLIKLHIFAMKQVLI